MPDNPIFVTRPSLPPLEDFVSSLEQIWDSKFLTNGGPFHQELEDKLANYLGVPYVSLTSNGDAALLTVLKSMDLTGEVITTPYSFVSTTHSILWNGLTPVFVDINPASGNIDISKIEAAITDKTSAILAVHCYGFPCDVNAIEDIAIRHGLKVIYDAAHAFGVKCHCGKSVLNHGDASILSFHATKVFNTLEGGAIISYSKAQKDHIDLIKNFGIAGPEDIPFHGLNAKMSEVNAAFGLLQLNHIDQAIAKRKAVSDLYCSLLSDIEGVTCLNETAAGDQHNYSYFPVIIGDDYKHTRDELFDTLKSHNIMSRKYFYPLLSNIQTYQNYPTAEVNHLPHANNLADHVLCLPIYEDLDHMDIQRICGIIAQ
jgi:dTDP-4-amino-4,6-dideoxygalactose transaminase